MLRNDIKIFIESHADLINDNAWGQIYEDAYATFGEALGLFTDAIIAANINPLDFLEYVPAYYMIGSSEKKLDIPEGVKYIQDDAFAESKLEYINLPNSLQTIGDNAFISSNIREIHFPPNITFLGYSAFEACWKLKEINMPDSITRMSSFCFAYCSDLERVKLSANLKQIDMHTFFECYRLKQLEIPESVTYISSDAIPTSTELLVKENSYAHKYCMDNEHKYRLI